jgi:hypothetical protein
MKSGWMAAILAALLASGAIAAELPATQPTTRPTPQVLALVHDLTSDQFSTRQFAQNRLEQMGEEAAPQLREILQDSTLSDEAAARIRTALLRIQEGRQFGPSVITIHCHDAPLAGVLEDFANQAGADLGVGRQEIRAFVAAKKISLDLDHVNFWTALRAIEEGSGLHARPNNVSGEMILDNNGGWFELWGDRAKAFGPCLIAPQSVNWSIQFARNTTSNLNLQLSAMVEPKLRVVGGFDGNWVRECVDEKGHQLVQPGPPMRFEGGGMRQWSMPLMTNLRVVPGMGKKIAKLTGVLAFNIQTKSELLELDDLPSAGNVTKIAGDNTITIQKFTPGNGPYQLQISVGGPASSGRWDIAQNLISSLQILDEHDNPLQMISTATSNSLNGQMSMTLGYISNPPSGPPKKLRWEITTETRPMKIPFELDDIDLPHADDEAH